MDKHDKDWNIDQNIDQNKGSRKRNKSRIMKKVSHRTIIALSLGILILVAVAAVISYNYLSYTDVRLDDMLSISLKGYNGNGEVTATVKSSAEFADFAKTVQPVIDKAEKLKNGDKVTITWEYDKKAAKEQKLRVNDEQISYTISGLKEARKISNSELFKDITVEETGISPYIKLTVVNGSTDKVIKEIAFSIKDQKDYYAAGDKYEIEAVYDEDKLSDECCELEGTDGRSEETRSVNEGDSYVTDPSEFTKDDINTLNKEALSLFTDSSAREYGLRLFRETGLMPVWSGTSTTFTWASESLNSTYFDIKSSDQNDNDVIKHINDVKLVYNAVLTQQNGTSCTAKVVVRFEDLIRRQDGSIDLNTGSGMIIAASADSSNISELLSSDDAEYDATKID